MIHIISGQYDSSIPMIHIASGTLTDLDGAIHPIFEGVITLDPASTFTMDLVSRDDIITAYQKAYLRETPLSGEFRAALETFVTTDQSGTTIPVTVSSGTYVKKKLR